MRQIVAVLMLLAGSAPAFSADRVEKIRALMEAQGLVQMFDQQREVSRQRCREQSQKMLDQMLTSVTLTPGIEAKFRSAADDFIAAAVEMPWTSQDLVDTWASLYAKQFTDAEIDQLLAFYTSPLGMKDALASRTAMPELSQHFAALGKPVMEKATHDFIVRLQTIIRECNCAKPQPAAPPPPG